MKKGGDYLKNNSEMGLSFTVKELKKAQKQIRKLRKELEKTSSKASALQEALNQETSSFSISVEDLENLINEAIANVSLESLKNCEKLTLDVDSSCDLKDFISKIENLGIEQIKETTVNAADIKTNEDMAEFLKSLKEYSNLTIYYCPTIKSEEISELQEILERFLIKKWS